MNGGTGLIGGAIGPTNFVLKWKEDKMETVKLTPEQEQQWADTMSFMAWVAPGFRHLWYKLLDNNNGKYVGVMNNTVVDKAATDGRNILFNPDWYFKLPLAERAFVATHEILHNVYQDVPLIQRCRESGQVPTNDGRSLPFDEHTMQRAMDLRINALLIASKIGKAPQEGFFDDKLTGNESVLDVYASEYKEKPKNDEKGDGDGDGGQEPGSNPGGFDGVLPPGTSTGQTPQEAQAATNPQQLAVELAVARTLEQMKQQGKMPAALQRMFEELLEPEVPWLDHIQTLINRTTGSGGWDWQRPDEWFIGRDIYQPHRTGRGAGWIVIWGDTSGSRDDKELASNMAELHAIMEDVRPQRLTVLWCDAKIDYIDEIEDPADLEHIRARGTKGGGGTSMQPVFDWIDENMETPDLFIGFTDGYVSFPREPKFPVIWASSTDKDYPYGEKVRVNKVPRHA